MHQELERHERAATDLKKRGAQLNRNRPALGRFRRRTSLICTSHLQLVASHRRTTSYCITSYGNV